MLIQFHQHQRKYPKYWLLYPRLHFLHTHTHSDHKIQHEHTLDLFYYGISFSIGLVGVVFFDWGCTCTAPFTRQLNFPKIKIIFRHRIVCVCAICLRHTTLFSQEKNTTSEEQQSSQPAPQTTKTLCTNTTRPTASRRWLAPPDRLLVESTN